MTANLEETSLKDVSCVCILKEKYINILFLPITYPTHWNYAPYRLHFSVRMSYNVVNALFARNINV